jgi:hypothetical protein
MLIDIVIFLVGVGLGMKYKEYAIAKEQDIVAKVKSKLV